MLRTFQHTLIHRLIEFCERFTKVANHENAEEKKIEKKERLQGGVEKLLAQSTGFFL